VISACISFAIKIVCCIGNWRCNLRTVCVTLHNCYFCIQHFANFLYKQLNIHLVLTAESCTAMTHLCFICKYSITISPWLSLPKSSNLKPGEKLSPTHITMFKWNNLCYWHLQITIYYYKIAAHNFAFKINHAHITVLSENYHNKYRKKHNVDQ